MLPYPVLLGTELVILGWLARTAWRFTTGRITPRPSIGRAALAFGGVYFAVMALRLLLGATVLSDVRWFASPLPAFFHFRLGDVPAHVRVIPRPYSVRKRVPIMQSVKRLLPLRSTIRWS